MRKMHYLHTSSKFPQNVNLTIIQELLGGDCEEKRDERSQCERERDHACPLAQIEQGIED